jgi:hypothetical protein
VQAAVGMAASHNTLTPLTAVLCCAVLCCAVLCCAALCCAALCTAVSWMLSCQTR